jgi:hypothetical protein
LVVYHWVAPSLFSTHQLHTIEEIVQFRAEAVTRRRAPWREENEDRNSTEAPWLWSEDAYYFTATKKKKKTTSGETTTTNNNDSSRFCLLASAGHPFESYATFIHHVADSCLNDDDRCGNPSIPATMSDKMMAAGRRRKTTF